MKNIKYAAIAIVVAFGFTACDSSSDSEPKTVTETVTATPEEEPSTELGEQVFLDTLRTESYFNSSSDADLLDLGHSSCDLLDAGVSIEDVMFVGTDAGVPPYEVGFLIGGAVMTLCPQHEDLMDEFVGQYGGGTV